MEREREMTDIYLDRREGEIERKKEFQNRYNSKRKRDRHTKTIAKQNVHVKRTPAPLLYHKSSIKPFL